MKECLVKKMKDILLIWSSFDIPNINFLPLGLGYIASNIGKDYNVVIKDFVLDEYSDKILEELIEKFDPIVIGISYWEINHKTVKNLVKKIKQFRQDSIVVLGGPSASARTNSGLNEIEADFAIKGEGEKSFELLLDLIISNRLDEYDALDKIPGLTYLNHRERFYKSIPIEPLELEDILWPDYEKIRLNDYLLRDYEYGYFYRKVKSCPIITTRGCPYQCEYCNTRIIHGIKIRRRRIESIIKEIEYLYSTYSICGINIIDDNFTFYKNFVMRFCKKIIARKSTMPELCFGFANGIRMDTVDDEMLDLMQKAGWQSITIAPESGSEETLRRMKKNITTA